MGNSSMASLETLIVLDYLLTKTNSKNLTKRDKIVEFALEKYNYIMDARKATLTLGYIYEACENYKKLPYKIVKVSTGIKNKYWGRYKAFDKKSLKRLLIAIFNSPFLSTKGEVNIRKDLCSTITDEASYENVLKELKNTHLEERYFGDFENIAYFNLLNDIEKARANGDLLNIDLLDKYLIKSLGDFDITNVECYVYDILYFSSDKYVILVNRRDEIWFSTPISNIKINEIREPLDGRINFEARYPLPENFGSIEEFLTTHILPYGFEHSKITFEIEKDDDFKKHLELSFYKWFKKELSFIRVRRDNAYKYECQIEMQHELFIDWMFSDINIISKVKILTPNTLIDNIKTKVDNINKNLYLERRTRTGSFTVKIYIPVAKENNINTVLQSNDFIVKGTEDNAKEFALQIINEMNLTREDLAKVKIDIKKR